MAWEHAQVVVPCDLDKVQAELVAREGDGWELATMVGTAMGGSTHLDKSGALVQGNPVPVFLMVFKRLIYRRPAPEKEYDPVGMGESEHATLLSERDHA